MSDPAASPRDSAGQPRVTGKTTRPLLAITSASTPLLESESGFTFVVMGDSQPALPRMPFSQVARDMMREVALLRPAFVLFAGDSIWGYQDNRQEMLNELDRFRALADSTGVPFFRVPGNHEMQSEPGAVETLKERQRDLYGAFDVGDYHFLGLNTDDVNNEGRVADEQLDWLKADLELNRAAAGIFVFMHRPLFSWFQSDFNPDDREELLRLFRSYPVRAVFAGHDHLFYEEQHDGVRYLTVGGGGGTLYTQPPAGGFSHYVLVTVAPGTVDYNVVEPNHLEVAYVAGNDGLEPVTTARVMNTTDRDLVARSLELRVPRLSSRDLYRVTTEFWDYARQRIELPVALRDVTDLGDGSVTLRVEVKMPAGSCFWVRAEAHEPAEDRRH